MFTKIVVAVALVVGLLWLMGAVRRVGMTREAASRRDQLSRQHRARRGAVKGAARGAEDLTRCPRCGAYHAAGAAHRCEG